jgi:hypothetical protein
MSDTKTQKTQRDVILNNRSRNWILTVNNYTKTDLTTLENLREKISEGNWQSEIGKNGTEHLQIGLSFKNAKTFKQMKKHFPTAHIEIAKNKFAVLEYCKKMKTSDGNIKVEIKKNKFKIRTKDPLKDKNLYDWQINLLKLIKNEPDDRTINWFWDPEGNIGKTSMAIHLVMNCNDVIYTSGKAADMKYGIMKYIETTGKAPSIIIIDYVRTIENYVSYQGIEEIKNGIFFNTKYECTMVTYDPPHVIIFANFEPIYENLSIDRWNVIDCDVAKK